MKHSTFELLRKAHLGAIDHHALRIAEQQETDPFVRRIIQLVVDRADISVPWDVNRFTTEFRLTSAPRSKLAETVFAFLLRCVAIIKEESYVRSLRKPESCTALVAWMSLLKECIFCITTLLYDVHWTSERWIALDETVLLLLHEGDASLLRTFFKRDLGLKFLDDCPVTEAEHAFHMLNFLNVLQFGPFFWRLLHWMAEAIDYRRESQSDNLDINFAIRTWQRILTNPLYRMLRCGICMNHLRQLTQELETQLLNDTTPYGKLWFNIHNKVNSTRYYNLRQTNQSYTEEEYAKDAEFMRQAFQSS